MKVSNLASKFAGELAEAADVIGNSLIHEEISFQTYCQISSMLMSIGTTAMAIKRELEKEEGN